LEHWYFIKIQKNRAQANAKPSDDRWIINGAHDAPKLQDYLDGFIDKFVLCKKYKNPETDVIIKDDKITLDCKACGQRTNGAPSSSVTTPRWQEGQEDSP
jgi:translation initiation factor 5